MIYKNGDIIKGNLKKYKEQIINVNLMVIEFRISNYFLINMEDGVSTRFFDMPFKSLKDLSLWIDENIDVASNLN